MKTFNLPDLGEGLHDATLVEWYAQAQSELQQGQALLAVETAKAIVEIPAPEHLIINELLANANSVVKVGMPLVSYIPFDETAKVTSSSASVSVVGSLVEASAEQDQRPFIQAQERFSEQELRQGAAALLAQDQKVQSSQQTKLTQNIALTGFRLSMSQQLSQAHQQVALVTLFDQLQVKWPKKTRPLPRLVRALCAACRAEPKLNAWLSKDTLTLHSHVNLGIAMNTEHGLFVPVLPQAETLSLTDIANAIGSLQNDAQSQRLQPSQLHDATISLSNFGMLAGRFATVMIVPPQVAILGAGRIEPCYYLNKQGKTKKRLMIPLSLSFDHRALTGAEAAHFLAAVMADLALKK